MNDDELVEIIKTAVDNVNMLLRSAQSRSISVQIDMATAVSETEVAIPALRVRGAWKMLLKPGILLPHR
jgi:hypothetical protein